MSPIEPPPDDLVGIRGIPSDEPRWDEVKRLNNTGVELSSRGGNVSAMEHFTAAYRATLVDDVDPAGLDIRARALSNMASDSFVRGDYPITIARIDEALEACHVVEAEVGNRYGSRAVRASLLVSRAQALQNLGRNADSLDDLDAAAAIEDPGGPGNDTLLPVIIHNARSVSYAGLQRWDEATAEAWRSIESALVHDPRLVGHGYGNLAAIAQATGDLDAAGEYLRLAADAHHSLPDAGLRAGAITNQGRAALRRGDVGAADAAFSAAERLIDPTEEPVRAADLRYSRAIIAVNRGQLDLAERLLREAVDLVPTGHDSTVLAECRRILADLASFRGDHDTAEELYLAARDWYEHAGVPHEVAHTDVKRGIAIASRCADTTDHQVHRELIRQAFDLVLPAALATDAMRHRFPPGPVRERWVGMIAAPAMVMAFGFVHALQDATLAFELIESVSSAVTFRTGIDPAAAFGAAAWTPPGTGTDPSDGPELPYIASTVTAGPPGGEPGFPATRFALPPRLRISPEHTALDRWITITEQRYGIEIRSRQVVDTW